MLHFGSFSHSFLHEQFMFEPRTDPLLPKPAFYARVARCAGVGLASVAVCLGIGMEGYHHFEALSWVDAFANAAMILSGMGPLNPLQTDSGKIFAGIYALFSGLAFITIISFVLGPFAHRFFHRFHLDLPVGKKEVGKPAKP
jgi:hypothetical protein